MFDIMFFLTCRMGRQLSYQQNLKWRPMPDKMEGKLVTTSNIESAHNQSYLKYFVFWLAQMMLFVYIA